MFWGIPSESWAQLWSGVIGSFIAAVIGGLVALGVVVLTNRQHSRQAELTRQMDALADFIAAADGCIMDVEPDAWGAAPQDNVFKMRSALARLKLSGSDAAPLAKALQDFPYRLGRLELTVGADKMRRLDGDAEAAFEALGAAVIHISTALTTWPNGSKTDRAACLEFLEKAMDIVVGQLESSVGAGDKPPLLDPVQK